MIKQLLVFSVLFFAIGCTTTPVVPQSSWQVHQTQVLSIENWKAKGKIAVKHPDESFSANFVWQVDNGLTTLRLTNMFGATMMLITPKAEGYQLNYDDNTYWGPDIAYLVRGFTDLPIPIDAMHHWILGLPSADEDIVTIGEDNVAASIVANLTARQTNDINQYTVVFSRYMEVDAPQFTLPMPNRFTATYDALRVKVSINDWELEQ